MQIHMGRGGGTRADATAVLLGILVVASGIGLAMRERRAEAAAICHGVHAPIACAGKQMASPAPDLFMPARGPPELDLKYGLFDSDPSVAAALERCGRGEVGRSATPYTPLLLTDDPDRLGDHGPLLLHPPTCRHLHVPGDLICIRSRPYAPPYGYTCRTDQRDEWPKDVRAAALHAAHAQ